MKRILVLLILLSIIFSTGCTSDRDNILDEYPVSDLDGIIQWGAGGGTDVISRSLTPLVEKHLGRSIVLQNKTGATGAIATQYVFDRKADGYTLLFGAENPQLYGVMDISPLSYNDFEPVIIIGRETAVVVVNSDSKYNSISDLIKDAKANPREIKLGTTGPGGLPFVVASLIKTASNVEFNQIPFDGDGPVVTALLGKHVDVTITKLSAAGELLKAGKVKILCSISNEPIEGQEEIPPIGNELPEYSRFLPWGPFYGVFVHKDTPKEVLGVLEESFDKGFQEEVFQEFLNTNRITPMGIRGKDAKDFLENWQRVSSWLLYDAGGAPISPDTLGIERID